LHATELVISYPKKQDASPNRRFPEHLKEGPMSNPRIYVACLASYNAGKLFGGWFEPASFDDAEALQEAVRAMLAGSSEPGAEEWAIHDHEGFAGIELSEYESLERVVVLAKRLSESEMEPALLAAAIHAFGDEWAQAFEEGYRGAYEHEGDYAEELATECHSEQELGPYRTYIDWGRIERDMALAGDITVVVVNGMRHIFTTV
jgi:antirestriction protein